MAEATKLRSGSELLPNLLVKECCSSYSQLSDTDKKQFLQTLATDCGIDRQKLAESCRAFLATANVCLYSHKDSNSRSLGRQERELKREVVPLYSKLFSQMVVEPEGLSFLVKLREDLLKFAAKGEAEPELDTLNSDLKDQLALLHSPGFLKLQEITWNSPASSLEYAHKLTDIQIMQNEAVHPFKSWDDLRSRLSGNRRCFALFHQNDPAFPLAFVFVALTDDIPAGMAELSHCSDLKNPRCAVFYSISSSRKGLSGIDLGNRLIKLVIDKTLNELKSVETFVTLSPIPGFCNWLRLQTKLSDGVSPAISSLFDREINQERLSDPTLKNPLIDLMRRYLLREKRRGLALDPVANFHLSNGAYMWRLNWMGDMSQKGLKNSLGMMINYRYIVSDINRCNFEYLMHGKINTGPELQLQLNKL